MLDSTSAPTPGAPKAPRPATYRLGGLVAVAGIRLAALPDRCRPGDPRRPTVRIAARVSGRARRTATAHGGGPSLLWWSTVRIAARALRRRRRRVLAASVAIGAAGLTSVAVRAAHLDGRDVSSAVPAAPVALPSA